MHSFFKIYFSPDRSRNSHYFTANSLGHSPELQPRNLSRKLVNSAAANGSAFSSCISAASTVTTNSNNTSTTGSSCSSGGASNNHQQPLDGGGRLSPEVSRRPAPTGVNTFHWLTRKTEVLQMSSAIEVNFFSISVIFFLNFSKKNYICSKKDFKTFFLKTL